MPKLNSLNLDGIIKRDISSGLLSVAEQGRLIRLMLAEGTNVSSDALKEIVRVSPRLRLLDISNNSVLADWAAASALVAQWAASRGPYLTILTNNHMPWAMIRLPVPYSAWTRPVVSVYHLHRNTVAPIEVIPGSVLSGDSSSQLPQGLLLPCIRRGNRYRLLCSLRPVSLDDSDDQKENSCSPSHPRVNGKSPKSPASVSSLSPIQPLFANVQNSPSALDASGIMNQMTGLSGYFSACGPLDSPSLMLPELCAGSYSASDFNELLQQELSLEAWMMWLSENQAYNPSTLPLTADPLSILTEGSAGAPRPPVEIPQQPLFHYSRGPRSKRRSTPQKQPAPLKPSSPAANFSSADFPPLQ
ncbi:hypothetical protein GCK32_013943 [Trichostrongylus colubriformis]|uniref:Uncharacterized protein n=1 Tax=Trichostrongylus colubriformis TaxID=6319 RepID=A0AAN8IP73_TRICO